MTPARKRVLGAAVALAVLLLIVNGIALVQSYWHARIVAFTNTDRTVPVGMDPPWDMTPWLPLTTDGLLLAALAVIYWRRTVREPVTPPVLVGAGLAAVGVLGANLANAKPTIGGWVVAAWPAITVMVGDVLVAMFLPTLGKAWQESAPVTVQVTGGDTAPTGPTVTPPAAVPPAADAEPVPPVVTPRPVPRAVPVSALSRPQGGVTAAVPEGRWTVEDEAVRAELQAAIDGGARMPTPTSLRRERNMNTDRGKRIIARLVAPTSEGGQE